MQPVPFHVTASQESLDDLHRRLGETRWPSEVPGAGWRRGVPLEYLRELVDYWQTTFDWRAAEARLNGFPQFLTEIDGAQIHFLHVRSPEPDAVPVILTHGWPGSVAEFLRIIGPLTDPRGHGQDPAHAVHLVAPSIPGYGFSGPIREPGWDLTRTAHAWADLMRGLGYRRYIAQGGDFGAGVSLALSQVDQEHVLGVHVNLLVTPPPSDPADLAALSPADQHRLALMTGFAAGDRSGYMKVQATRPQTLAYTLTDSPAGLLAWIVEKFWDWTDCAQRPEEAVDRDQLLTNVTIYWLTGTAGSSANLYYELRDSLPIAPPPETGPPPMSVPLGVAVFPREMFLPIRRFAERAFPNLVRWTEYDRGGHFAAMEQPDLLVADIQAFIAAVRAGV